MGLGLALGLAAYAAPWRLVVVIPLTLWWGLAVAVWWLRRAIAFQQAGGPYLFRLATFKTPFAGTPARQQAQADMVTSIAALANRTVSLWDVCLGTARAPTIPEPSCRHLLVTGPLHSGKTSLVAGIVTEFAFAHGAARYLEPVDLLESLATAPDDTVSMEFVDGRWLWKVDDSELIVVDDLDAAVPAPGGAGQLIQPLAFASAFRPWAGHRRRCPGWRRSARSGSSARRPARPRGSGRSPT